MDRVVPGGVDCDLPRAGIDELLGEADVLEAELRSLRAIYYDHPGLQDRCINCGVLAPRTAAALGVVGLAARASGIAMDARVFPGFAPYDELQPKLVLPPQRRRRLAHRGALRGAVRVAQRSQRRILGALPAGDTQDSRCRRPRRAPAAWAGSKAGAARCSSRSRRAPAAASRRCHPHDPSWQNWPALEHAVIGNIVPDFPLINKSFNLSYAGADL